MALEMLGDDDERVRLVATRTLIKLIPKLYYASDWPIEDALANVADEYAKHLVNVVGDADAMRIKRANLTRICNIVITRLHASQSHPVLIGCYHALNALTQPDVLVEKNSDYQTTDSGFKDADNAETLATPLLCLPDVLPITLDHLRVAWMYVPPVHRS